MSEVSAEAILEIFNSNNGSKTERLNQIAELCQAAIDEGPVPDEVETPAGGDGDDDGGDE